MTLTEEWVFKKGNKVGLEDLMDGQNMFFVELDYEKLDGEYYDPSVYEAYEKLWEDIWDAIPTESKNKSVYFTDSANDGEIGYVSIEGIDSWDLDVASELLETIEDQGITSEEEAHNYLVSVAQAVGKLTDEISEIIQGKIAEFEKQTGAEIC
ncbi:TPA: hypothetical protein ACGNDF_001518 [Streptococcus agalactiae]